jgi:S1-C subfamily serine protease
MNFADYASNITAALDANNQPAVQQHCRNLQARLQTSDEPCPLPIAKKILAGLRRKRQFVAMQHIADSLLQNGQVDPLVSRQYAQALIDRGLLALAIQYLNVLLPKVENNPAEQLEVLGLLGRAYKQLFVESRGKTARATEYLGTAIDYYVQVYSSDASNVWHGINAAALLARASRDGAALPGMNRPKDRAAAIAAAVLEEVESRWTSGVASMWDSGTAAEACIALDRVKEAAQWMERYVREPMGDAFEFGSTRRQMVEIWQLTTDADPGKLLLPILDSALLAKDGSALQFDASGLAAASSAETQHQLEAILGRDRYVSYKFMKRALERAKAIAQIRDESDVGIGTGFLVRGGDIAPCYGDELLLLTNAHVVSDDPYVVNPPALAPEEATVSFGPDSVFAVKELLWTSPPNRLDVSLLRLDGEITDIEPIPIAKRLPLADGEQRVYIIGHPRGGPLSFSIHDNTLIAHEGPPDGRPPRSDVIRLHYRAPTEGGSSGSPVFNAQWVAIGLHHAGGLDMPCLNGEQGTYPANEGLWLQSIRAACAQDVT